MDPHVATQQVPTGLFDTVMVTRAIDALAAVVGRLDGNLDRILAAQPAMQPPAPDAKSPQPESMLTDKAMLERELETVLAEVTRVRAEITSSLTTTGDTTPAPDDRKRLGKLRRRQALILARLLQLDGDSAADEITLL